MRKCFCFYFPCGNVPGMNESIRFIRTNVCRIKSFWIRAHWWVKWVSEWVCSGASCSVFIVFWCIFCKYNNRRRQQLAHTHTLIRSRGMKILLKLKHKWEFRTYFNGARAVCFGHSIIFRFTYNFFCRSHYSQLMCIASVWIRTVEAYHEWPY